MSLLYTYCIVEYSSKANIIEWTVEREKESERCTFYTQNTLYSVIISRMKPIIIVKNHLILPKNKQIVYKSAFFSTVMMDSNLFVVILQLKI